MIGHSVGVQPSQSGLARNTVDGNESLSGCRLNTKLGEFCEYVSVCIREME